MTELKACQCGAVDSIHMNVTYVPSREDSFFLEYRAQCECLNCGRRGPIETCDTEHEARAAAIAGWNTNTEADALRAALVRARSMLMANPPLGHEVGGGHVWCVPCGGAGKYRVSDGKLVFTHADDCEYQQTLAACNAALEVKA